MLQDMNFYSLLIPMILLCLSILTLWISLHKKIANYLLAYAWALGLMGITILLNTTLPAHLLSIFGSLLATSYFLSFSLHTKVLYQRVNAPFSWRICIVLTLIGTLSLFFFSHLYEDQIARIFTISLVTTAIHFHRPIAFFQAHPRSRIDAYLRVLSYIFTAVILSRSIFLSIVQDGEQFIAHRDLLWASTQFLIIVFYLLFFILLMASAWYEIMAKLNEERILDPLTGLSNRRGLQMYIQHMAQAQHEQHAVLIADLDHFKKINDSYGHAVGDQVLQHVSKILCQNVAKVDHVARMGGEEFVMILQDIDQHSALQIAERIRHNIEKSPYLHDESTIITMTLSIGISFFSQPEQIDSAMLAADEQLYRAKTLGRNQIQLR